MNVQKLNDKKHGNQDSYKSLLLLDEISKGEDLSQRDLSKKLNIALGLVNSYIKNLIAKGYITIKNIPSRRYTYYLTPKGFTEKSRLTYDLLHDYTRIFREARREFRGLFNDLIENGIKDVVFAGADEVAEIAYLSLQEVDIELAGIVDDTASAQSFFKTRVKPLKDISGIDYDVVVLTTFLKRNILYKKLIDNGVDPVKIKTIYQIDMNDNN
ncbi:MAG TPA: transcriptional regulator [Nitrospiraceae bacterium]|nr:transcriptional regulator [Nitrospiraceae bacterium]